MGGYVFVCDAVIINVDCHSWRLLLFIIKIHHLSFHTITIQPFLHYLHCWRQCVYLLELKRRIERSKITSLDLLGTNAPQHAVGFFVTWVHCWPMVSLFSTWIPIFSCAAKWVSRLYWCTGSSSPVQGLWTSLSWTSWQPSLPISPACWSPQWQHNHCYMNISPSPQLCIICQFPRS